MPGLNVLTAWTRLWLREPAMIVFGAIPASVLLAAGSFFLYSRNLWGQLAAILAFPGTIGLWIASFQDPSVLARSRLLTVGLLVLGLVALGPFSVAVAIGSLKHPSLPTSSNGALVWWTVFGPVICAVTFISAHVRSRIRRRASNNALERERG
jgi:hypothetical protein